MSDAAQQTHHIDRQHFALALFIQLEQESRHVKSLQELYFLIANETKRLIPYYQAFVINHDFYTKKYELVAISGVPDFEKHSPYIRWIKKVIAEISAQKDTHKPIIITHENLSASILEEGKEWFLGTFTWIPCVDRHQKIQGGLLLTRLDNKWEQNEISLLERLGDAYAFSWLSLRGHEKKTRSIFRFLLKKTFWIIFLILFVSIFFIPVPQSALAPAEITPKDPFIVTSPLDGIIKEFLIEPNTIVTKGQIVLRLDDTNLRNKLEVAKKSYDIALADYTKTRQQAFLDEKSKAQVNLLKAQMDEKAAEVNYNQELLQRVEVKADKDGIAIFSNPFEWIGKPVQMGEKILLIADPQKIELNIMLPIDEAISLKNGSDVKLFLNIDPINPLEASLTWASYEAKQTPNNIMSYQVKADFKNPNDIPRIGLKGTAKIFGDDTTLFYYVFRRPISSFRRFFGI
ncbi:MAG: HlyD family efflux transporter periplasmic adaptor subunit [Alphaproteobacteria bacterium]|nr:HlyD family efflux transporter periplasmic adaptor subunit [Alphaproteobacteria bacterium]